MQVDPAWGEHELASQHSPAVQPPSTQKTWHCVPLHVTCPVHVLG